MTASVVLDIEGTELTVEDRELLTHPAISGVILFSRNYESPQQLQRLTSAISSCAPLTIYVDQEGGRVQRFREHFSLLKPMSYFGKRYLNTPEQAHTELRDQLTQMAQELKSVGVHASLLPVLDLDYGLSDVIGERSLGRDPKIVSHLAEIIVDTLHLHQMPVTAKHFPGHGCVKVDSHFALPVDDRDFETIQNNDLIPFCNILHKCDYIMPAHIIFPSVDSKYPVGFSARWLKEILRKKLGFKGKIMTDDLSMKATEVLGNYASRACAAIEAGCDLLLVCNNRLGAISVVETANRCQS